MKKIICLLIVFAVMAPISLFSEIAQVTDEVNEMIYTYNGLEKAMQDNEKVEIVFKAEAASDMQNSKNCCGKIERTMLFFDPNDNASGYVIIYGNYEGRVDYHYIPLNNIAAFKIKK